MSPMQVFFMIFGGSVFVLVLIVGAHPTKYGFSIVLALVIAGAFTAYYSINRKQ